MNDWQYCSFVKRSEFYIFSLKKGEWEKLDVRKYNIFLQLTKLGVIEKLNKKKLQLFRSPYNIKISGIKLQINKPKLPI